MSLAGLLRVAVLALLAALVLLAERVGTRAAPPRVTWIGDALPSGPALDSLLVGAAPALVARSSTDEPTAAELEMLAALADRAPLLVARPRTAALVEVSAPTAPRMDRAAAVPFRVRGDAGDSVLVRLADAGGVLDSVRVRLDGAGQGAGAFRVRPPRPGWREWTVDVDGRRASAGAWVDSAAAPRVLVRAGFPGWESRFAVRALEESGAAVSLVQPLGRGLFVGDEGGPVASPSTAPERYDVVVLLDGAEVDAAERRALADFASRGGGVLVVGDQIGATPPGIGRVGAVGTVEASRLAWSLPPELAPLPSASLRSSTQPLTALAPGTTAGARVDRSVLLALRPLGRGRVAALGVTETWRWRMEAGRLGEHREFWRGLVDWLAGSPRGATVRAEPSLAPVGSPVAVTVFARGASSDGVRLTRPDGRIESLSLAADSTRPGVLRATFVPASPGVHRLGGGGNEVAAAVRAVPDTASVAMTGAWARLALLAERSGGAAVAADSLRAVVARRTGSAQVGARFGWTANPWVLLLGLVALAGTEWAVRRLRGWA